MSEIRNAGGHRPGVVLTVPALVAFVALSLGGVGCTRAVFRVGVALFYEEASLPAEQVVLDVPYRRDADADEAKHRLDLFVPETKGWPVMVFVHGGGWTSGDRALVAGGADVYRNIGRYFAKHGVGTAVISYRLIPYVTWQEQVDDVAHAVHWVHENIGSYGGDAGAIFLAGHSAGAHLITHAALDRAPLAALGEPQRSVCGLIPISGAAYDLRDDHTFSLGGGDERYYAKRFANGDGDTAWRTEASPIRLIGEDTPPTMIMYTDGEPAAFAYQAERFSEALREHGVPNRVIEVPHQDHFRIVLALSRDDLEPTHEILDFIKSTPCRHDDVATAAAATAAVANERTARH